MSDTHMDKLNPNSGVAYVPPEGWDVWLHGVEIQQRRKAQIERERPPEREAVTEVRVERAVATKARRVNTRRKGH